MACEESNITIPQDIIIDILYHLPVKSLGRFRCVSKQWLSLLSETGFIKTHQKSLNRNHLIFWPIVDGSLYSVPVNNHEAVSTLPKSLLESKYVYLYGSINGLVLVSANKHGVQNFVVLNLTTREYVKFPNVRHKFVYRTKIFMTGFGYDSETDDYKVVTISYEHIKCQCIVPRDEMYVHVYSLRSGTWRKLSNSPYDHYNGGWSSGVNVNGCIHWIGRKDSHHIPVVVAFSLVDEKFSEVPSPPDDLFTRFTDAVSFWNDLDCKLVEFGGKLAIFHDVKGEVWLMNEYGIKESWTKIVIRGFDIIPKVKPLMFYADGKLLVVTRDQVLTYNLEEQTFCKSVDVISNLEEWRIISGYAESLVSPKFADRSNQYSSKAKIIE